MTSKKMVLGVAPVLFPALALIAACGANGNAMLIVGDACEGPCSPPGFTEPDAGAEAGLSSPRNLCVATECPSPYATCGEGHLCSTNLSNDSKHCGVCGKECPTDLGYLNLTSSCVEGTCEPACATKDVPFGGRALNYADCNGTLEDGCEVLLSTDPDNCGMCGNRCAPGVRCFDGKCGCDLGKMDCDGRCINVRSDDNHCGTCGNVCNAPDDAGARPPNMYYGCVEGQCGLKCIDIFSERYADCDHDLSNGCEIYVGSDHRRADPNNCGLCGNKCAPGQTCWDDNSDRIPECGCQPYETMCGSFYNDNLGCRDLLKDIKNCGTCFNACPVSVAHQISACQKGVCIFECAPGWGDCDLEPNNGCETDLSSSNGHCGACGNRCDTQAGQPCVEGRCVMKECDAGVGPQ